MLDMPEVVYKKSRSDLEETLFLLNFNFCGRMVVLEALPLALSQYIYGLLFSVCLQTLEYKF